MGGEFSTYGKRVGVYRVLLGRPEGKRPLRRPIHGWEDNIKMDLQEMVCRGMDWIDVVWYRTGGGHL
jgi:hypothetical protein